VLWVWLVPLTKEEAWLATVDQMSDTMMARSLGSILPKLVESVSRLTSAFANPTLCFTICAAQHPMCFVLAL